MNREAGTKVYTSQAVIWLDTLKDDFGRTPHFNGIRAVGFHPVYESYEDFKADWPDEEPLETTLTEKLPMPESS